ncbi:8061_t:CDS:2 [Paraglomus brasilianum]|uniref:Protein phosphatase n=1 Tax=Paraglomus brasilianum TaxID=144538 RepID=A0A9N9FJI0_9GLOM|nr:8061_t:CDS:2 [Paraglomus brasilianum]
MSSSISPFYRPGAFPVLSSRVLASASQSLRLAIQSQHLIRSFYSSPPLITPALTTTKGFTYLIGAAWSPKRKRQNVINHVTGNPWWREQMRTGKVDAGEDAFFYVLTNCGVALGVADGVGGWSQMGVDSAAFSWDLMDNAANVAKELGTAERNRYKSSVRRYDDIVDAKRILSRAFENMTKSGKVEAGSSTACILSLSNDSGILNAATLGDSAFLLIRSGRLLYESPSQQHFFNCPYQLTLVPEHYPNQKLYIRDKPSDADQSTHQLQDGDVILLATDGFYDNVFPEEAVSIVNEELDKVLSGNKGTRNVSVEELTKRVRGLSRRLTDTARKYSEDRKRISPFSKNAMNMGESRLGGKIDDITVLITLVRANS